MRWMQSVGMIVSGVRLIRELQKICLSVSVQSGGVGMVREIRRGIIASIFIRCKDSRRRADDPELESSTGCRRCFFAH